MPGKSGANALVKEEKSEKSAYKTRLAERDK